MFRCQCGGSNKRVETQLVNRVEIRFSLTGVEAKMGNDFRPIVGMGMNGDESMRRPTFSSPTSLCRFSNIHLSYFMVRLFKKKKFGSMSHNGGYNEGRRIDPITQGLIP